jgi:hypothetical protein
MAAFHDKSLITDDPVRARFEYRLRANDGYTIQQHLSDHRAPYSIQELSAISVPALFVWCREDQITPLTWGEDYAAGSWSPAGGPQRVRSSSKSREPE